MIVKAKLFANFQELFGGRERRLDLSAEATVGEALGVLCDTPARLAEIFVCGELKPHLVVMVNGVPVRSLKGLSTPLTEGDTLAVFPMMGGG
jgi:molybdopterin converting factor small subunit